MFLIHSSCIESENVNSDVPLLLLTKNGYTVHKCKKCTYRKRKKCIITNKYHDKVCRGDMELYAPLNRFITKNKFLPFICEREYYMVLISNILNTVSGHSYPFHQRTQKKKFLYTCQLDDLIGNIPKLESLK